MGKVRWKRGKHSRIWLGCRSAVFRNPLEYIKHRFCRCGSTSLAHSTVKCSLLHARGVKMAEGARLGPMRGLRVGKDLHGWVVGSQIPPLRLFWGFIWGGKGGSRFRGNRYFPHSFQNKCLRSSGTHHPGRKPCSPMQVHPEGSGDKFSLSCTGKKKNKTPAAIRHFTFTFRLPITGFTKRGKK